MLASCFRMSLFLRLRDKETSTSWSPRSPFAFSPCPPGPLLSNVAPRKTEEKSWIPNVAGLLHWQEILRQICLSVKSAIQTRGILKFRLEFLGLGGFVALNYMEQASATCLAWELAWWEEHFSKYDRMGGFARGIHSVLIPSLVARRWLECGIVVPW